MLCIGNDSSIIVPSSVTNANPYIMFRTEIFYHKLKGQVIMQCVVGSGDLFGGQLRMWWFAG